MTTTSGGSGGSGSGSLTMIWECVVFVLFVCASTAAPLWRSRQPNGKESSAKRNYVFATGTVSSFSIMLSLSRGTLGVRSFLGFPSELVYHGSAMWETLYGMLLAFPVVCWLFVPLYYRLNTTSVYEYLEARFNSVWVRRSAAATFILRQILTLAVTVYTPTVALHAVLGLPHMASAAAITGVGVVFTLLGGLKAAIIADVIQTLTMVLVSAFFIIHGTYVAGGPANVMKENIAGGRLQFFKFTGDPSVRVDTSSALIGQLFMSLSVYGCQQQFVQRYTSLGSLEKIKKTLYLNVPVMAVLFSLSWIVGMALYAVYKYCDPLLLGFITAPDEILAYYVQNEFRFLPGMLGLFLGSLFNGALSILVSNINSIATVTWEDFISSMPCCRDVADTRQVAIIRCIGVIYGVLIMLMSLTVGYVGGVFEASQLVTSATAGALLGVFVLAAACPICNAKGAVAGVIVAHSLTFILGLSRLLFVDTDRERLPTSIAGCSNSTLASVSPTNSFLYEIHPIPEEIPVELSGLPAIFNPIISISYMWYGIIGTLACVVVGCAVGALTQSENDAFDERLLNAFAARCARAFPGKPRRFTHSRDTSASTDVFVTQSSSNTNEISVVKSVVTKL